MTQTLLFRPATAADEPFLWEMLLAAIHLPAGAPPPPREILHTPDLARYVDGWGRPGDCGVIASDLEGHLLGAAWLRLMRGYGWVDDQTPELSMAVAPGQRGAGLGTQLLRQLLAMTSAQYPRVSLSVSPDNPALKFYLRFGFQTVGQEGDCLVLLRSAELPPRA